jgi:hypothetical protein
MWSELPDKMVRIKEPTMSDIKDVKAEIEKTATHNITMDEVIRTLINAYKTVKGGI